ncbi:TraI/MobA(P) family conjugative relaxase [Microbulbifer discodermiae]|uniref:TraI/MobA(P) family conjugative relaxase n=1 Tax=Microbulbifer sp. 2201CG32-9 TaxID=3232309 RepID=UPI00345C2E08
MIAKRSPRRSDSKSSFKTLANYITDQKNGGAKVAYSQVSNCKSDRPTLAVAEIEATQALNTRAKNDKTYHLIVSMREGDSPTPEQLQDIEQDICSAIGLADHQRMSAYHTDTNNPHLHIAINKIHPETLRMVEPYYDQYRLGEACERLEIKHDLQVDNHAHDKKATRKATPELDEMREGGQKPLADWLAERKPDLGKVENWQQLHQAFAALGVELKRRGNGLSILDVKSGIAVKASAVDRQLSKAQLEKRFGVYQASPAVPEDKQGQYHTTAGHIGRSASRVALWDQYTQERNHAQAARQAAYKRIREAKAKELRRIKLEYEEKRAGVKRGDLARLRKSKQAAYSRLKAARVAATERVTQQAGQQRAEVRVQHAQPDWREWLQVRAGQGDEKALEALRTAKPRKAPEQANQIAGDCDDGTLFGRYQHQVHRNGAVTYRFKSGVLVDHGRQLSIGSKPSPELIEAGLKMALHKFGKNVQIKGNREFLAAAQPIAAKLGVGQSKRPRNPSALEQFIQAKNRQAGGKSDMLYYRRWQKGGTYLFLGVEESDQRRFVILQGANQKFVKELTDAEAQQLQAASQGSSLSLSDKGAIQIKRNLKRR